jgi:3'-phosphoadenosine 5'-phosphosulfate sulfotransferase (PAPS reductase)/FAD synthetase
MNLRKYIGEFDESKNAPTFGFPLLNFENDEEDENKWCTIRRKLNPLKEMMHKNKKNDDAFDIIFKSFTYVLDIIVKVTFLGKETNEEEDVKSIKRKRTVIIGIVMGKGGIFKIIAYPQRKEESQYSR